MKQERRDILQIDTQMSNRYSILPEVIWSNLVGGDPELLCFKAEDTYLEDPFALLVSQWWSPGLN